jgi:CubicO group peptidase (beta-lactamase class C family)
MNTYHLALSLWFLLQPHALVHAQTTIKDLSQDWTEGALYNKNKAYCKIQSAMTAGSTIGYVVVQNGQLVAEGYTCGSDAAGKYDIWSVTKSWSSFLIGVLVDQGKLSVTETMGDVFNEDADWVGVNGAAEKKAVTIQELLTMSSGLVDAENDNNDQSTLQDVLNHVDFDANQTGEFYYLAATHILSRIIERRAGQTPREFATSAGIFSKLGMSDSDFEWTTFGGVEGSAYGLMTNPRILAKLGQLYLQDGLSAPGEQLVSASWVNASVQTYVVPDFDAGPLSAYGYQWYPLDDSDGGAGALGAYGQILVFSPASNVAFAIMSNGCLGLGGINSYTLLNTILENLQDLTVEQASCIATPFSYWNYFRDGLKQVTSSLRGSQPGY